MATKRKMRNMGNAFAESTAGVSIESMINIAKQYGIDVSGPRPTFESRNRSQTHNHDQQKNIATKCWSEKNYDDGLF